MATKTTHIQAVYNVLSDGTWWSPFSVQNAVAHKTGNYYSESSTGARIRDLRKLEYGAYTIEKKKETGKRYYLYRMVK